MTPSTLQLCFSFFRDITSSINSIGISISKSKKEKKRKKKKKKKKRGGESVEKRATNTNKLVFAARFCKFSFSWLCSAQLAPLSANSGAR